MAVLDSETMKEKTETTEAMEGSATRITVTTDSDMKKEETGTMETTHDNAIRRLVIKTER
jgi:hypothetical protein